MKSKFLSQIPKLYNPYLHLTIPSIFGLIIFFICCNFITYFNFISLLTILFTVFSLFGFEWFVHKNILHHPRFLLKSLYEKHEIAHHSMYSHQNMSLNSLRELYFILMPTYAIFIVFGLLVPIVFLIGWLISLNSALIILSTSMVFFLMYEWLHLLYHLPKSKFTDNVILNKLRVLHTLHHKTYKQNI